MRTKYLLFSTIFATAVMSSCSNEEFVENAGIEIGGEKVAISITAQKGGDDASTRSGINVGDQGQLGSQYWEASDKLGGLLYTAVDGSAMLTNYPFIPTDMKAFENGGKPTSMSFKTPTAVSKGTYVFYTPYATNHVGNAKFEVELSDRQEMDPANPTAHLGANNFMIAPAISLAGITYGEEGAINDLPIQFRSIYNLTRISIKLENAKAPVTIQRIVVRDGNSAPTALKTNSQIVPDNINTLVKAVTDKFSDGKSGATTSVLTSVGELDASKATAADYELAAKALEVSASHVTQTDGANAIVLAVKGGKTLNAGETFDAYVLLPAGAYSKGLKYDIYTDKGVSAQSITTADLGVLNAARSKKISCTLNYTENNNNIELPMNFDIASDQDWKDAVSYVTTNFGSYGNAGSWKTPTFNLLKDTKGTLPTNFKITVTTNANKLTLEGTNTLNTVDYTLNDANIINEGTLTIAGGATGTVATPKEWTVNSLVNKGTVSVGTTAKLTITEALKNLGDLTNAGEVLVTTTTDNGETNGSGIATITNTGKFTATTALTNHENGVINVNNTTSGSNFTLSAASSSAGAINIADKAKLTASVAALTNTGVITLNGGAKLDGGANQLINADATIVITDPSKDYELTVPASAGTIKTTVSTKEGITVAATKVAATANNLINAIELTSSIKLDANLNLGTADLSLAAGVKLEINKAQTVTCKTLVISGAGASLVPYDAANGANPTATVTAGTIEVKESASLTVEKNLTVGTACTTLKVGKAATLTNNGTIQAHATTPDTQVTVSVSENGSFINSATGAMTNALLNITTNEGTIQNLSAAAIKVAGGMVGTMSGKFTFVAP